MTKMVKIKTNSAFVNEDGKFINAGEIVEVSEPFLETQNKLCEEFGIVQHELIARIEPVKEAETGQGENAETEKQPETEPKPDKAGKGNKGSKGDATSTSDDL